MTSHAQADRTLEQRLALTEWLSAEELHAYQVPLLAKLLDHARVMRAVDPRQEMKVPLATITGRR